MLIATTVADGLAIVADGIAAFLDLAAGDPRGFWFEVASVVVRVAVLIGDFAKLGIFHMPATISDFLQGLKVVANIVDAFEGILNLFNPIKAVAQKAASFAMQIVKPEVQAGILQIIASLASSSGATVYQKYRDITYYDGLRDQINSYTDAQLYYACTHQYYVNDPGQC